MAWRGRLKRVSKTGSPGALAASLLGVTLTCAPTAAADPVTDSWYATCRVLDDNLNGDPAHDAQTIMGVKKGVADYYKVTWMDAVAISWRQVTLYCPIHQQRWLDAENWQLNR